MVYITLHLVYGFTCLSAVTRLEANVGSASNPGMVHSSVAGVVVFLVAGAVGISAVVFAVLYLRRRRQKHELLISNPVPRGR